MEDVFKPQSLTIKQLFGNPDALYQIPRYQRPYSWSNEHLEKLWEDLQEAQHNDPNYFLGSIITAKPEGEVSLYLDVVDGQQRLTTLLILLAVYRDLYPNLNEHLLDKDPFAIDCNIIKSSIKYNDRFERLRLKTHTHHESDFRELILKEGAAIEHDFPSKKSLKREEDPNPKFINTAAFFTEKLEEIGEEEAGYFINYLFNKVKIIRIDCQDVSFAIKLFQVLNDRGLDLSNSDLIKSYLIGKINEKYKTDSHSKKHCEDRFMDDWKYCENIALDTEESLNDLFVMYEYYLLGSNPEKSLYDELVRLFDKTDANDVISDFRKFVTLYKKQIYLREDATIYGFWYLRWSMYWKAIVLTALHTGYKEFDDFLPVFKRYYYLNWIAGNTLSKIKQTSFNLIKWLKDRKPLSQIAKELEKLLTESNNHTINRAIENLSYDIYNEPWCKPLLFMIEYNQQDKPSFYNMSDKNIQVEHILPRAYRRNEAWAHISDHEDVEDWIDCGGNLTLLSGSKNLAASNLGFSHKINAYDGTGNHSKTDQKVSSFKITQNIVNDYNVGKYDKKWNYEAIESRWIWFCEEIEKLFSIYMEDVKDQKIIV